MDKLSYRCHRFPSIVIQQAVWLYFRFALSYRDVEEERGIDVSYETVRRWALKFGGIIARELSTRIGTALSLNPPAVYNVFNIQRHLTSRRTLRVFRDQAMLTWRQATVAA